MRDITTTKPDDRRTQARRERERQREARRLQWLIAAIRERRLGA